jgi:hypothetical protein
MTMTKSEHRLMLPSASFVCAALMNVENLLPIDFLLHDLRTALLAKHVEGVKSGFAYV